MSAEKVGFADDVALVVAAGGRGLAHRKCEQVSGGSKWVAESE